MPVLLTETIKPVDQLHLGAYRKLKINNELIIPFCSHPAIPSSDPSLNDGAVSIQLSSNLGKSFSVLPKYLLNLMCLPSLPPLSYVSASSSVFCIITLV